jgi:hypothetical protein
VAPTSWKIQASILNFQTTSNQATKEKEDQTQGVSGRPAAVFRSTMGNVDAGVDG